MLKAKKSLGQHFLNSRRALEEIILAANIKQGDIILEIGPGTGILTFELLKCNARVIAIEKDIRAMEILKDRFSSELKKGNLSLIHADILDQNLNLEALLPPNFSIVANIPYYITGAILEKFLEKGPRPNQMVLLVQKEVAERILARDAKESVLSISVKAFGKPSIVATVPRGAFMPPPKVDSAILKVENISGEFFQKNDLETAFFFKVLKTGFAHKRKYLARNLEAKFPKENINMVWENLEFDKKIRSEDLAPEKWLKLVKKLAKKG